MYHEYDPPTWTGPTEFYGRDHRSPPASDQSRTWDSLYVWATPEYGTDVMYFSMRADTLFAPPDDRSYLLELLQVPDGVVGAPELGTIWEIPLDAPFTVELPTFATKNGLEGYRFAFTVSEVVPEPTTLSLLAIGGLMAIRRRR